MEFSLTLNGSTANRRHDKWTTHEQSKLYVLPRVNQREYNLRYRNIPLKLAQSSMMMTSRRFLKTKTKRRTIKTRNPTHSPGTSVPELWFQYNEHMSDTMFGICYRLLSVINHRGTVRVDRVNAGRTEYVVRQTWRTGLGEFSRKHFSIFP